MSDAILLWIGDGKNVLPVFPPRDLTEQQLLDKLGHNNLPDTLPAMKEVLIGTGLYKAVPKKRSKVSE